MYLYHFGLSELPFTLTPNTHFYYGLPSHSEALQVLLTALKTGEGFIKVTGEVGTGKTLICRKLMNELPETFVVAYIPNPYLSPEELRWALATEIGATSSQSGNIDQLQLTQLIQYRLMQLSKLGKSVVLIIDEAQALPAQSLEALRLFTNLETESKKLLQVVMFGQPELDERLASKEFRQLRQRISFSYHLRTMHESEVMSYIHHRIQCATVSEDNQQSAIFSNKVCQQIARASRGVPRLVNVLCHKALMLSYGQGIHQIEPKHIEAAVIDTEDTELPFWLAYKKSLLALTIIPLVFILLFSTNTLSEGSFSALLNLISSGVKS